MLDFKAFSLNEEIRVNLPSGIFVKVLPTTKSIDRLKSLIWEIEYFGPLLDDLHCTVIYSKADVSRVKLPYVDRKNRYTATPTSVEYWPGQENEGYLVLKMDSIPLTNLHWEFRNQGIQPSFADYKAHVSLVHPVDPAIYEENKWRLRFINEQIRNAPSERKNIEFYYGGYVIQEELVMEEHEGKKYSVQAYDNPSGFHSFNIHGEDGKMVANVHISKARGYIMAHIPHQHVDEYHDTEKDPGAINNKYIQLALKHHHHNNK